MMQTYHAKKSDMENTNTGFTIRTTEGVIIDLCFEDLTLRDHEGNAVYTFEHVCYNNSYRDKMMVKSFGMAVFEIVWEVE